MNATQFLALIWGTQQGYVFLPQKRHRWSEGPAYKWPMTEMELSEVLDGRINDTADQYYCPNVFRDSQRRNESVLSPHWLYADLDAVDPRQIELRPTLAVTSSPGRYQSLWQLARPVPAATHEDLNRRLTYSVGADKGGWDLSQVLRLPGTRNLKYTYPSTVRILWDDGPRFSVKRIREFVKGVESHDVDAEIPLLVLPEDSSLELRKRYRDRFDGRTKALLNERTPQYSAAEGGAGIRSDKLWELECRLIEHGLSLPEVFVLVKDTVWNKFEGRSNGDSHLWSEVQKASTHIGTQVTPLVGSSGMVRVRPRIISYADIMGGKIREPDWLVEDWWTLGSHGIVAGLPKSYKSVVSLDLAFSVASETPFLGHAEVNSKGVGPVLIVQQENSLPLLRDRFYKLANSRGLGSGKVHRDGERGVVIQFPPSLPIHFYNDFAFDMASTDDREALEQHIQEEGPRLILFDPLYLMIGDADENSAKDMRPILSWLLRIRNLYNCAVVVVHHWGKGVQGRGGKGVGGVRLLGSTTIYGWLEAALYLEASRQDSGQIQVVAEREFRERLAPPPIALGLTMGQVGEPDYGWEELGPPSKRLKMIATIEAARVDGMTVDEMMVELGMGEKTVRRQLKILEASGEIVKRKVPGAGRLERYYASEVTSTNDRRRNRRTDPAIDPDQS